MVFCNFKLHNSYNRVKSCHNPYFNRWFSAIKCIVINEQEIKNVTILILIDGFLQLKQFKGHRTTKAVTILILIDGFLQ